ncbi:MAG: hypothetical protein JNJ86_05665 [Chitinophagaceae bacterium]|jgi:hypothetical protein|nr:hypothetical protein [Chitinophagaceae bacterium]
MKKIILMLAITISTLSAFAGEEVNPRVLASFKSEFASAKEVAWTVTADYFKAEFTFNGQYVNAFYNTDGELMGLTRNITSLELPMNLQASLKKSYEDFWISDLFEITRSNNTGYYITLENADTKIVLKATAGEDWSVYKKVKKV